jgi:hypothetical protein
LVHVKIKVISLRLKSCTKEQKWTIKKRKKGDDSIIKGKGGSCLGFYY